MAGSFQAMLGHENIGLYTFGRCKVLIHLVSLDVSGAAVSVPDPPVRNRFNRSESLGSRGSLDQDRDPGLREPVSLRCLVKVKALPLTPGPAL